MYEKLETLTLRDGGTAEFGIVSAPDPEWCERIEAFLAHQDDLWKWQNRTVLQSATGIDVYYYVAHRDGELLSIMMSAECRGVGIRGHVWTPPARRRNGACSRLQTLQMEHFRSRAGRYLCLFTNYNSVPYHLYRKVGFQEVEPQDGHMQFLSSTSDEFEADYFAAGRTAIEPLGWRHWPSAAPLFMGDFAGRVRCAPLGLVGRRSPEQPVLAELREAERAEGRVMVLRNQSTDAVAGLAAWSWHPGAQDTCLVDVYCHPWYWDRAGALLASLEFPDAERFVSYGDARCEQKEDCLRAQGFRRTAVWPGFPADLCRGRLRRLPRSAFGGQAARAVWTLARAVDTPVSTCWRSVVQAAGAPARIPERWPRVPLTHGLHVDLTLYVRR